MNSVTTDSTLVVLAHPEAQSFNGHWAQASVDAGTSLGQKVLYSDLVSMGFDPVEKCSHYAQWSSAGSSPVFDPLKAQEQAVGNHNLPADVAAEIAKIRQVQRIIFHFPLWWFGPPAILKGWLDRCLVHGELHTIDQRFDTGSCAGKKALFCVSTGATETECSSAGKEGDVKMLLWPLAYTLRYLGFTVLQPCVVHGVHGYHEGEEKKTLDDHLQQVIDEQNALLSNFDTLPVMAFNRDDEFDENGLLRKTAPSHSYFIRHASGSM